MPSHGLDRSRRPWRSRPRPSGARPSPWTGRRDRHSSSDSSTRTSTVSPTFTMVTVTVVAHELPGGDRVPPTSRRRPPGRGRSSTDSTVPWHDLALPCTGRGLLGEELRKALASGARGGVGVGGFAHEFSLMLLVAASAWASGRAAGISGFSPPDRAEWVAGRAPVCDVTPCFATELSGASESTRRRAVSSIRSRRAVSLDSPRSRASESSPSASEKARSGPASAFQFRPRMSPHSSESLRAMRTKSRNPLAASSAARSGACSRARA